MSLRLRSALLVVALAAAITGPSLPAQGSARPIRGIVITTGGAPVADANVFVLETLDGVLTGPDGRFEIRLALGGTVTLVVRRLGYAVVRRELAPHERDTVTVRLERAASALTPIAVQAGSYTAGEDRGATLTPLEVVTTPGAAADINRTIQALPGVQAVDEGTALFVRGGDHTETKVFLNDAPLLNPVQLLTPSGTFVGTVDPFLLDGIFFSSGGFGARYGDALSGIAGLRTRGPVERVTGTAGAGLAAVSAELSIPITPALGVRAAANRSDLRPFLRVNDAPRHFDPPPHGRDLSGSVIWSYRPTAEVKVFAIDQTNVLGVAVDDPAFSGLYDADTHSRHAVAGWRDVAGPVALSATLSESRLARREAFGAFRLATDLVNRQLFAQGEWQATTALVVRAGGEVERLTSSIGGSIPASGDDVRPDARTTVLASDAVGHRTGTFVEMDWRLGEHWRVIPGLRRDRSSLTRRQTFDPRLAIAYQPFPELTLTGAAGVYHQVPDPLFFDDSIGLATLPSMRATQAVAGLQLGQGNAMLRVEAYTKRYRDLAQQTRDYVVVSGGSGRAEGVDIFIKAPMAFGVQGRTTMSFVNARRTDPNTGQMARAPYDVSFSGTWILERAFGGLRAGLAYRTATGRPFTPVHGATLDPERGIYVPHYADPMSQRLPSFHRVDLSLSQYRPITPQWAGVLYLALSNVFDRTNVHAYRYTSDYAERVAVPSIFNRAIYVGASLVRQ